MYRLIAVFPNYQIEYFDWNEQVPCLIMLPGNKEDSALIISTSSHNVQLSGELDDFVAATMQRSLDRLRDDIVSIDVFMKDVNGPRGGVDKHVVARIHLRNRINLIVEATDENLRRAIQKSAGRAKRAVTRRLKKSQGFARRRLSEWLDVRGMSSGIRA